MQLAQYSVRKNNLDKPNNYRLSTLYEYITSNELENAHTADADVDATVLP